MWYMPLRQDNLSMHFSLSDKSKLSTRVHACSRTSTRIPEPGVVRSLPEASQQGSNTVLDQKSGLSRRDVIIQSYQRFYEVSAHSINYVSGLNTGAL